jgi:tetraacyldisaccharide 4'-kinase
LIVVGEGSAAAAVAASVAARGKPVLSAHLKADRASVASLDGKRVLAFAGIGDPSRFFRTLRACGIEIAKERAFADHHAFSKSEIEGLIAEARDKALALVTTEKDLTRLRTPHGLPGWAQEIAPLPVSLEIVDAAEFRKLVSNWLLQAREKKFRARN